MKGNTHMKSKTRLKGLRNIHFASNKTGTFVTPVHLSGAKKIESELKYELEQRESDNIIDEQEYVFTGGEGKLVLKSLTPIEHEALFDNETLDELVIVRTTDNAPSGALLFERNFAKSHHKRLYCIFNTLFAPCSLQGESSGKGTVELDEELSFSVGEYDDNVVYIFLDTDTTNPELLKLVETWYTKVPTIPEIATIREEMRRIEAEQRKNAKTIEKK